MLPVEQPFKTYTGLDGKPLNDGYVYFGQPGQNPITAPITVYWDAAGTIPAAQPLRTAGGYIMRGGAPANVFCDVAYSETVLDSKKRQVLYARDSSEFSVAFPVQQLLAGGASKIKFIQAGFGAIETDVQTHGREIIYAEEFDTLAHAVAAAGGKTLVLNHAYDLDCLATDGLVIATDNVHVTGRGTITANSINNSAIKITGKNVVIEDITVKGPGAYDTSGAGGAVIPGLIYIDGSGLAEPINCRIDKVKVLEPGKMGIVAYKAVGIEIVGCRVENSLPVSTWLNTSNNHLIRLYSCARYRICDNYLRGFSEGIVVQAYPDVTFDDFAGTVSNASRKGLVCDNIVLETYDHCIYFANGNEHYICNDNFLWMAADYEGGEGTCSLKLEGGYFEASGNYCREGIQMRNPYNGRVESNQILIYSGKGTAHNPSKMGILSQDVIFQRDLTAMAINNNTISVVGDIEVDAGIWIEGAVYSGYQSKIVNLSVCENMLVGVGKNSSGNGLGILIHQDMPKDSSGNVTGASGIGVTVANNTIELSTYTGGAGSIGIELLNIDVANVHGNTVRNFASRGINALGMRYSHVFGNNLTGNAASPLQRFATFEGDADQTLHVDSVQNTYGVNHAENVSYKYFPAHQSTVVQDMAKLLNAGAASYNQSISSYDMADLVVWAPTASGLTMTLDTTRPWGVGQKVGVINQGTQPFSVTNTGTTLQPNNGTMTTFCHLGAGVFVAYS